MRPTNDSGRFRWIFTVLLGVIAAGGAIDLALDRPTTLWSFHVLFEVALLAASIGAVAYLWLGWRGSGRKLEETGRELRALSVERDVWRTRAEKFLKGLGEEIERQLKEWGLTPAERETALTHGSPALSSCLPKVETRWTSGTLGILPRRPPAARPRRGGEDRFLYLHQRGPRSTAVKRVHGSF